jgi:hypothetical protein
MNSTAVNAARRIGVAVPALALYALGLPVPFIAPVDLMMPPNVRLRNAYAVRRKLRRCERKAEIRSRRSANHLWTPRKTQE